MKVLPQALEIIFKMLLKKSNEKITKKEINFSTYKTHFFPFFFSFWTLPIFKAHNFFIFYSFKTI